MQIKHMICDTVGAFLFLGEETGQGNIDRTQLCLTGENKLWPNYSIRLFSPYGYFKPLGATLVDFFFQKKIKFVI